MQILTRNEATHRAAHLHVSAIDVVVDLRDAKETTKTNYPVTSTLTLTSDEERTFIDIAGEVKEVLLNGQPHAFDDDEDRVWVGDLPVGETITLEVRALASYSRSGEGLHRYTDPEDGEVYLYTQFEPNDAHRAWPCVDQPDVKPEWTFHVIAPAGWVVSSNGVETTVEVVDDSGALRHDFTATRPLSSYITAIVAGPWAVIDGGTWSGGASDGGHAELALRLLCRRTLARYLDSDDVFEVTRAGLDFFHERYGVTFPWGSYDQVYVPEYNLGAMENPGCITFNENYISRSTPTFSERQRRANTTLHEMCHMWFGDLATPSWWDDLWLKESFAENQGASAIATATRYVGEWANFAMNRKIWAYTQDQMPTTHPIAADIPDVAAAKTNFDGITYAKGASVLKQLVYYVGREKFFQGINQYLNKYAYSNATLADLLHELEKASGRDLKAWSAKWLEESGINTIATEVEENADGTIASLTLNQTAPAEHPVLRPHRLAVGFYDEDPATGKIVRTDRFELDVDGKSTVVAAAAGKKRPAFILVNDDDLTYTKLRFDADSLSFALANLQHFDDALARAVVWLSLWDMTRDGDLAAEKFIDTTLALLATETESTTFRYALSCMSTTAWHYTAPDRRADVVKHVAKELWKLVIAAPGGSDQQFQLVTAYLGYGEEGDAEFAEHAQGLFDGSLIVVGLEIDNNFTWTIINALSSVKLIDQAGIDAQLAKRDTTENREFALGAHAVRGDAAAKEWAWNEALNNADLTNMQLEAVARGFAATPRPDLAEPYAAKYYDVVDWVWKNKSFHMAEALLEGLYPYYADPATLVELGHRWLADHEDADNALKRIVRGNVESSQRTLKVRDFNAAL